MTRFAAFSLRPLGPAGRGPVGRGIDRVGLYFIGPGQAQGEGSRRALPGTPGPDNAITDVEGIHVGHTTLISGEGELRVGEGPVRTGVTAILPRADAPADPVFGGWFSLNGNGEMTGTTWIEESGFLEGPIAITNTHSVGVVRDAIIAWQRENGTAFQPWSLPVVAETYDGSLNDINGFHVKPEHLRSAIANASGGTRARRQRGGRHGHELPRVQVRHRDVITGRPRGGRLHRGCAGPGELRAEGEG